MKAERRGNTRDHTLRYAEAPLMPHRTDAVQKDHRLRKSSRARIGPPYEPAPCPRCGVELPVGHPGALSRTDNETEMAP